MSQQYVSQFQKEDRLHTVGYFDPKGKWQAVSDHEKYEDAANEVARLNGGAKGMTEDQVKQLAEQLAPHLVGAGGKAPAGEPVPKDKGENAVALLREFGELWHAAGIMGFAAADQKKVPELLAWIQRAKSAVS